MVSMLKTNMLALFAFLWAFTIPSLVLSDDYGSVVYVEGEVKLRRGLELSQLMTGTILKVGDVVITSNDSVAEILLGEGNEVNIQENTKLKLEEESKDRSGWNLELGSVRVNLEQWRGKAFEVVAPSAVAGVRGTDFVVEFKPDQADAFGLAVLEGEVVVEGIDNTTRKRLKRETLRASESIRVSRIGELRKKAKMKAATIAKLKEKHKSRRKKPVDKGKIKDKVEKANQKKNNPKPEKTKAESQKSKNPKNAVGGQSKVKKPTTKAKKAGGAAKKKR